MSSPEQQKQTGEKVEIRAVGWMKGREYRQREKGSRKKKQRKGWRGRKNNQEDGKRGEQQTARGAGRWKRN